MKEEYMLQKGTKPCVAIPAEKVTACCSAMPTSNARSGIAAIIKFMDEPEGMAGVTPMMRESCSANSTIEWPNTSWYLGACGVLGVFL